MKVLKRIIIAFLAIVLLAVIGAYVTGNDHLISGIPKTYLKGKTGPDIDDFSDFHNETIVPGAVHPWKTADNYNLSELPEKALLAHSQLESVAFLVLKEGEIIFEKYWEDYSEDSFSNSFSMAKSIVGMTIGIAINEGKIKSVDQNISDFIPQFKNGPNSTVTIEQLLQMKSNIAFDEKYKDPFGFMAKAYYGDDLINKTLSYAVEGTPGTKWQYLGGNTLLLAIILERATGQSIHEYVQEKLWKPMGAKNKALWSTDEKGGFEKAYCCFYSNARDFARFGQMYLCQGNFNGKQIIPSNWVDATLTPVVLDNTEKTKISHYGYQWWLGTHNGMDFSAMRGILGQYVIIVPDKEMVIVRLGHKRSNKKLRHTPIEVYDYIDEAIAISENQ